MRFITLQRKRRAISIATTGCLVALFAMSSYGQTEQPFVKLGLWVEDLEVGPGMNAVGKHLRGSEFVGQDLRRAVFDGCDLYGVRFYKCDLSDASFKAAHMTGMLIGKCTIDGADFTDAIINGILKSPPLGGSHADIRLSEEQLVSTRSYKAKDLSECVIYGFKDNIAEPPRHYDFHDAILSKAVLIGDFSECSFAGASIQQIVISGCIMTADQLASTTQFQIGELWGASLACQNITGKLDFSGMDLAGTWLSCPFPEANFDDTNITGCKIAITNNQLRATRNYREGDLSSITFMSIDLSGFDFSAANLTRSFFSGDCDFAGASFDDTVITDVFFDEDNRGLTVAQIKSTWNYKHRRMEGITLPEHIAEALRDK